MRAENATWLKKMGESQRGLRAGRSGPEIMPGNSALTVTVDGCGRGFDALAAYRIDPSMISI